MTSEEFELFNLKLSEESKQQQIEYKQAVKKFKNKQAELLKPIKLHDDTIEVLKHKRKELSNSLQQQIFEQYNFLNANIENKNLLDIFNDTAFKTPPAGAGECCAPKLLQYAYKNKLKPLCMAEFWWGVSPTDEIRKHGYFYPACNGKCKPILGHMLEGLNVEQNPLQHLEIKKEINN